MNKKKFKFLGENKIVEYNINFIKIIIDVFKIKSKIVIYFYILIGLTKKPLNEFFI